MNTARLSGLCRRIVLAWLCAVIGALLQFGVFGAEPRVIINEIMYHPAEDQDDLQYIELYNCGSAAVDLSDWKLKKGVTFVFPQETKLEPEAYVVICRNRTAFARAYGAEVAILGEFSGRLKHSGEKLELRNNHDAVIDSVQYLDTEPWPVGPDGYAPSLERICPYASTSNPQNWAASDYAPNDFASGTPGGKNSVFSTNLPPSISHVESSQSEASRETMVTARVSGASAIKSVSLLWVVARPGSASTEIEIPMERSSTGTDVFRGKIPAQQADVLVRFRIKAVDALGSIRCRPQANEPQPAYSLCTFQNTNNAQIAFAYIFKAPLQVSTNLNNGREPGRPLRMSGGTPRGQSTRFRQSSANENERSHAFIYVPPAPGKIEVYDFVHVRGRSGGNKVHFSRNQPFHGMTGINLIFEGPPRWMLSEYLAYEVYRRADVPAALSEHLRVWMNGRALGYQLMVEQPNKGFLSRNGRDTEGNLYKVLWYGNGIIGQHEKKISVTPGHDDVVKVVEGLKARSGAAQWKWIEEHFNVAECASYYAVNMCIQNWDGYHNNYFAYHDLGGTGKWEIYPWDEDKTWGDYDGASSAHNWYEMPLTTGMAGERPTGSGWWRPGTWFAGPLLANPEFRKRYLARLAELCRTVFDDQHFLPVINTLEKRLEPEIPFWTKLGGGDAAHNLAQFHADIQSFRNQLKLRRQYILSHLEK